MYKFDFNADLREVWLRLAGKFKAEMAEVASLVQEEEQMIRKHQTSVQFRDEAPNG